MVFDGVADQVAQDSLEGHTLGHNNGHCLTQRDRKARRQVQHLDDTAHKRARIRALQGMMPAGRHASIRANRLRRFSMRWTRLPQLRQVFLRRRRQSSHPHPP